MSYDCPYCGTKDINLEVPVANALRYHEACRVATPCCKRPIKVYTTSLVHIAPIQTSAKEDDWGEPYRQG